jgi:hypothetical protein
MERRRSGAKEINPLLFEGVRDAVVLGISGESEEFDSHCLKVKVVKWDWKGYLDLQRDLAPNAHVHLDKQPSSLQDIKDCLSIAFTIHENISMTSILESLTNIRNTVSSMTLSQRKELILLARLRHPLREKDITYTRLTSEIHSFFTIKHGQYLESFPSDFEVDYNTMYD